MSCESSILPSEIPRAWRHSSVKHNKNTLVLSFPRTQNLAETVCFWNKVLPVMSKVFVLFSKLKHRKKGYNKRKISIFDAAIFLLQERTTEWLTWIIKIWKHLKACCASKMSLLTFPVTLFWPDRKCFVRHGKHAFDIKGQPKLQRTRQKSWNIRPNKRGYNYC